MVVPKLPQPLSTLTVLFLVPLGFFFLGEHFTVAGIVGVVLILGGALLVTHEKGVNWSAFIMKGPGNRGVLYAIAAALFAALAITATKFSFAYVHPIMGALYIVLAQTVVLLVPAIMYRPRGARMGKTEARDIGLLGMSAGFTHIFHHWGLSLLPAAYLISLKRLSVLINVVMGRVWLHEKNFLPRLLGTLAMLAGVVLIAVGGFLF
jgi:drug/metabolite transporter (DMT)-like permease